MVAGAPHDIVILKQVAELVYFSGSLFISRFADGAGRSPGDFGRTSPICSLAVLCQVDKYWNHREVCREQVLRSHYPCPSSNSEVAGSRVLAAFMKVIYDAGDTASGCGRRDS